MERTESARASFAGLVGAAQRRDRRHCLGLGRRECDRERPADGGRARQDRRLRLRVPDRRPDLARAGARGYTITHVPQGGSPVVPAGGVRRRDRRAHRAGRDHAGLLPQRRVHRHRGRDQASRTSAARSCCSTPTRRSDDADRRARARRRPARRRCAQVPARLRRPRLPLLPPRSGGAAASHRDRLVRGRRRVRDGHPGLLAGRRRPPVPGGHAADPEHLRRDRGHRADEGDRHRGDPRARLPAQRGR